MFSLSLLRFSLFVGVMAAAMTAGATQPAAGTLSLDRSELSFDAGPHAVSNPSSTLSFMCTEPILPCDDYALTLNLPPDFAVTNPAAKVRIALNWSTAEDFDLQLLTASGESVGDSGNALGMPEMIEIAAGSGVQDYIVRVVPFTVAGGTASGTISLLTEGAEDDSVPVPAGLPPRYQIHVAPPALGNSAGEPTIGYNPLTQRAMFIALTQALRVTFPENQDPARPASCDATWQDRSGLITTLNSLDPILTTDQTTGRTFNSQLSGANSLFEYSDDDGETWHVGQIAPPNGGVDHQAVGVGPYPEGLRPLTASYPNAVYYCSQSIIGAFCARSDDGGQTFGPGFPFKNTDCVAGALHGHPKVAPDGTVYVPDSSQCVLPIGESAEKVVAFVSEDAGLTWAARAVPQSTGGAGSDPSVGIATDGTVYMCYENADGTAHVAVSQDKGLTWTNDRDIGAAAGLVATRFPAMVAGDGDRAACAFLGTTTSGDSESLDFTGVWHPYIATTYDGGESWHLVNVSPGDPVQGHGGVGPSGTNRNLLDFNDAEIDEQGRVLFAYADGCIGGCVQDPSQNGFAAKATIARQSGGRTLFAAFDNLPETRFNSDVPLAPAPACMNETLSERTAERSVVRWNAPDDGGEAITNYRVYRAESAAGPYKRVANTRGKPSFVDTKVDAAVASYFYQVEARNSEGLSVASNVLELNVSTQVPADSCSLPGATVFSDSLGDGLADDTDLEFLKVAEPPTYEGNFVFSLKVADFTLDQPPAGAFYPVLFPAAGNRYVAVDASTGMPRFVHGTYAELLQGILTFTESGLLDERSTYAADGTMILVVPKTLFPNSAPGSVIAGFDTRARLGLPSAPSRDLGGPGDYTVRGTAVCATQTLPLASLSADQNSGAAPLTVHFTAAGSQRDDEPIVSYTLDFGDGSPPLTQSSPLFSHTYSDPGAYPARLSVTDASGRVSENGAVSYVEVRQE